MQVEKLQILDKFLSFLNADSGEERWVTIKGQHVKIDGDGNIVAGNPKVAGGDSKVTSGKSDIDFGGGKFKTKSDAYETQAKKVKDMEERAKSMPESSRESYEKHFVSGERQKLEKMDKGGKEKSVKLPSEIKKSGGDYKKDVSKLADAISDLSGGKIDARIEVSSQSESTYLYISREDTDQSYKIRISDHVDKHGGNDWNWSPKDGVTEGFYKKIKGYLEEMGATNFGSVFPESEKKNASDFPKFYYTRHMQAGLCGYPEHKETVLVRLETMQKMADSMNGKPVYILHQEVDLENIKQEADGYVTETWIDPTDGWMWSKFMIIEDSGHEVIRQKGYKTSNAYIPTNAIAGGEHQAVPYDREITDAQFTHLALVPNPRYEGAKIYTPEQYQARNTQLVNSLANSKPTEKKGFVMKFWKKEEVSDASTADFVEYTNGKGETVTKSVEEMKNALEAEAKQAEVKAKKVLVNGKEMTVAELTKAYEKLNAKKKNEADEKDEEKENEDDEDEKENEAELVTETRVNEDDEDLENEDDEDEEKTNSKPNHFKTMKNAHLKNSVPVATYQSRNAKIARGRELFSSK